MSRNTANNHLYDEETVTLTSLQLINEIRKDKLSSDKLEKIKRYLDDGANINIADANDDGNTALHIAVKIKDYDLVDYLIANGASVDIKNSKGETALNTASEIGFAQRMTILFNNYQMNTMLLPKTANPKTLSHVKPENRSPNTARENTSSQDNIKKEVKNHRRINIGHRAGKTGLHGEIYQLKLLILFLKRGLDIGCNFRLTTEMEEAKKFDDLVFEITRNDVKEYRLLQAKHKSDDSMKISWDNLLTESDGDFSLVKYFFSYHELKKEKLFKKGIIKDVTVCTNINFDFNSSFKVDKSVSLKLKNVLLKLEDHDMILGSELLSHNSSRYKFTQDIKIALKDKLQDYNLTKLAKRLTVCFLQNKDIKHHDSKDIFQAYHLALANNVIDVKNRKFYTDFITGENLDQTAEKFRSVFAAEIKKQTQDKLNLSMINDAFENMDFPEVKLLNISKKFGKGDFIGWPTNIISDIALNDFLDHLVFAVDQPNEKELGNVIKTEIGHDYDFGNDTVYNKVFMKMLEFVKDGGEQFISNETGKTFFGVVLGSMWFEVKDPVADFIGREDELEKLKDLVFVNSVSNVTCISGIGGTGKSELLRKFIYDNKKEFDYNIIWINAKNSKTIVDSFIRLAQELLKITVKNSDGSTKDMKSLIQEVYDSISKKRKCLFVMDNMQKISIQIEENEDLVNFIPVKVLNSNNLCFIITSQNQKWDPNIKVLPIQAFSPIESVMFIKKSLKIHDTSQNVQIEQLASALQHFPLALQQAVAYIIEKKRESKNINNVFWIENYLQKFMQIKKDLLCFDFPEDNANPYTKTTFVVWDLTINSMKMLKHGGDALEILNVMSYFASNDISVEMLTSMAMESAMELLKQFSMVYTEEDPTVVNVNRLVQYVMRLKLKDNKCEEMVILDSLELLKNYVSRCKFINLNHFAAHIDSVWSFAINYEKVVEKLKDFPSMIIDIVNNNNEYKDSLLFGRQFLAVLKSRIDLNCNYGLAFLESLALAYFKIAEYNEAFNYFETIYLKLKTKLGRLHVNTLNIQQIMISTLIAQNKLNDAHSNCLEIYNSLVLNLGSNNINAIDTQSNIALILNKQCKYQESLDLYNKILDVQTELLGSNHLSVLETKHNLASVLKNQCRYEEALNLYEEVYRKRESVLGSTDKNTLKSLTKVARVNVLIQRFSKALRIYYDVLKIQEVELGLYNEDVFKLQQAIAFVYIYQDDYDNALLQFENTFKNQERVLGPNHNNSLQSLDGIAFTYQMKGNYVEALRKYKLIVNIRQSILGFEHKNTLRTMYKMGQIQFYQNKFSDALSNLEIVLKMQKSTLGMTYKDTLQTLRLIGSLYQVQGEFAQAFAVYKEVLKNQEITIGKTHKDTFKTMYGIASVYLCQGAYKEALENFEVVLRKREDILGPNHKDTLRTLFAIATIYENQSKYTEALMKLKELFQKHKELTGTNPRYTLRILHRIGTIYLKQRSFLEALVVFEELLKMQKKLFGSSDKDTLRTEHGIATVYLKQSNFSKALEKYENLLNVQRDVLDPYHRDTLETLHGIAAVYLNQSLYDDALLKYQNILEIQGHVLGHAHKDTLNTLHVIAGIFHRQKRYEDALLKYETLAEIQARVFRSNDVKGFVMLEIIGDLYFAVENFDESLSKYTNLLKKQETVLPANDKHTLKTLNKIGNVFLKQKNYAEALLKYEDLLSRQKNASVNVQGIFKTMSVIAQTCIDQGNYSLGLLKYKELLKTQGSVCGPHHESTLATLKKIAAFHRLRDNNIEALSTYNDLLVKQEIAFGLNHRAVKKTKREIIAIQENMSC